MQELKQQITCQFCDTPIQLEGEADEDYEGEMGVRVSAGDESADICEACYEHYN